MVVTKAGEWTSDSNETVDLPDSAGLDAVSEVDRSVEIQQTYQTVPDWTLDLPDSAGLDAVSEVDRSVEIQ